MHLISEDFIDKSLHLFDGDIWTSEFAVLVAGTAVHLAELAVLLGTSSLLIHLERHAAGLALFVDFGHGNKCE